MKERRKEGGKGRGGRGGEEERITGKGRRKKGRKREK